MFSDVDVVGANEAGQVWNFSYRETFQARLAGILCHTMPLPPNAIFFGLAEEDGAPVFLDVSDPDTGAILVAGGPSSGKTALLQVVTSGISYTHDPAEVQFAVITPKPWQWTEWENSRYCSGIFAPDEVRTANLLTALGLWMKRPNHDQTFLLFVDGLEMVEEMDLGNQARLQNLLAVGPASRIWTIATVNTENLKGDSPYLPFLETRLLCLSESVSSIYECKYSMKENSRWLTFSMFP
jgi:hypothetical protein